MSAWTGLNLARPKDWRRRRALWVGAVGLAVLFAFTALNVVRWHALENELQAIEDLQRARASRQPVMAPFTPAQAQSSKAIQDMLVQLAIPWEGLFKDIEAAANEKVRLESLQPQSDKSQVMIKLAADDFASLIGFVNALNAQQTVSQARLASESYTSGQQPNRWQGVVQATWTRKPND